MRLLTNRNFMSTRFLCPLLGSPVMTSSSLGSRSTWGLRSWSKPPSQISQSLHGVLNPDLGMLGSSDCWANVTTPPEDLWNLGKSENLDGCFFAGVHTAQQNSDPPRGESRLQADSVSGAPAHSLGSHPAYFWQGLNLLLLPWESNFMQPFQWCNGKWVDFSAICQIHKGC